MSEPATPVVVVTGANGLVGSRICAALSERGVPVRALVRRPGTAPDLPGVEERVGEFSDPAVAADACTGATALVTTVHPMLSDADTQRRIGVEGTAVVARAAAEAGVARHVHVSTAAVYARLPAGGDVDESSALVGDDADPYALTKRDTDAAIAAVEGTTRVVLRPPAILGPAPTSVWNTLRPRAARDHEGARRGNPEATFSWVHVDDLAALAAAVAVGEVADATDPDAGPLAGGCTVVDVAADPATLRDYLGTVTDALGVEPVWTDEPAWTGRITARRARAWGWTPRIGLDEALAELAEGLDAG